MQRREEDALREEDARREALTTDTLPRKIEPLSKSLSRRKSKIDLSKIQQEKLFIQICFQRNLSKFSNFILNENSVANVNEH